MQLEDGMDSSWAQAAYEAVQVSSTCWCNCAGQQHQATSPPHVVGVVQACWWRCCAANSSLSHVTGLPAGLPV